MTPEEILDLLKEELPKVCPFCGNPEIRARFWEEYWVDDGNLGTRLRDYGADYFCGSCEEHIRKEDYGKS